MIIDYENRNKKFHVPYTETVHEKRAHGEVCNCTVDCNCDVDEICTCSGKAGPCMCGPNCNCRE
jgi:hypothetical protein